jgi:hypothetical protein
MMSYAASVACSSSVLSYCCTEHGQQRGVALLSRITTVAMSRSGQIGQCCTVAWHCSAHLHGLQVMMTSPACTFCRRLGNARACLRNTRA